MRSRVIAVFMLAAAAAAIGAVASSVRTSAQSQFGDANVTPAPFNPQMSALMAMLIQPRHTKMWLAGKAENWPLAGYMFQEMKQGFMVISRAVPRWKGLPVPDLMDAALTQPLAVLDFAIKAGDPRQFAESYDKLTAGCNACHSTMEHSYVVIKTPDSNPFPDQEFQPAKR